jgi:hypothetical protein
LFVQFTEYGRDIARACIGVSEVGSVITDAIRDGIVSPVPGIAEHVSGAALARYPKRREGRPKMSVTESDLATSAQHKEVEDVVLRLGRMLDDQDFAGLAGLLAESVHVDYTSLFGGEAQDVSSTDLLNNWRSDLDGVDSAQHIIIGPLAEVAGDRATASANIMIVAKRSDSFGAATWSCGGRYELVLERKGQWVISSFTLKAFWTDGNINVLMRAVTK